MSNVGTEEEEASLAESLHDQSDHSGSYDVPDRSTRLTTNGVDEPDTEDEDDDVAEGHQSAEPMTPVKCKFRGDPYKHVDASEVRDGVLGCGKISAVEDFESNYLRNPEDIMGEYWKSNRESFVVNMKKCSLEKDMYSELTMLLTKVCLDVCESRSDGRCLAVYMTSKNGLLQEMEGSGLKPDLVLRWTTREEAKEIAKTGIPSQRDLRIYWNEVVSFWEVKRDKLDLASIQAGQYAHVLPRALPNLAGILYAVFNKERLYFYWSDTSGMVRSHHFLIDHENTWQILYQYISTLVAPLDDLPARDPTMELTTTPQTKPIWRIRTKEKSYDCELIAATFNHSRQTCVFETKDGKRIVKDHWRDDERRFREDKLLEKVKGVPGVVQVEHSEEVEDTARGKKLRTSGLHSGRKCKNYRLRRAPRRTKLRSILKSKGRPLATRRSVGEILKGIHDSVQGHRICYKKRKILHRDVSRYNILLEPKHDDATFDHFPDYKFISQVLDPSITEVKEKGMLIDLDNAADLEDTVSQVSLTCRTGTPMFVAVPIASGKSREIKGETCMRASFPELTGKAKEIYISAYGQERYDRYLNAVNSSPKIKELEEDIIVVHRSWHDCESFAWVLAYELMTACPENEKMELSKSAQTFITVLEDHEFTTDRDTRQDFFNLSEEGWKRILHPCLAHLSRLLTKLFRYFKTEWEVWAELPDDHAHEVLVRLLIEAIVEDEENNIKLKLEPRKFKPPKNTKRRTVQSDYFEVFSPKQSSKRNRPEDASLEGPSSKKSKETSPSPAPKFSRVRKASRGSRASRTSRGSRQSPA